MILLDGTVPPSMVKSQVLMKYPDILYDAKSVHRPSIALPYDIILMIWEFLGDDKHSLSSCALVCRSWTTPCQKYLFEHFVVNLRLSYIWGFYPSVDAAKDMPPLSLKIASYVKHLTIQPTKGPDGRFPLPKSVLTIEIIDAILRNLTNLHSLSIHHVDLRRPPPSRFEPIHVKKSSMIPRLHFENAYIGAEAFRVFTMFSEIKELSFSFCGTVLLPEEDTKIEQVIHASPAGLRVSTFRIANADLESVMEYFARLFHNPSMQCYTEVFQTLTFGYTEFEHCIRFLQNPELRLSEIRLDFSLWSHTCMIGLDWNRLNEAFVSISPEIIRLAVPVDYAADNYTWSVDRITKLPDRTTHLSLVIWYPDPASLTEVEKWNCPMAWKAWNQALNQRTHLKEISILMCLISGYENSDHDTKIRQCRLFDNMKRIARAEFSAFSKRGILRLQDFDHHSRIYPDSQFMESMDSQRHLENFQTIS